MQSGFRRGDGDRNFPGFDGDRAALLSLFAALAFELVRRSPILTAIAAILMVLVSGLLLLLMLRRSLVHRTDDAEVVLGVLEITFAHHAVARAGRVAAELKIFFEELLRRATNTKVGAVAVEDMVAVQRDAVGAAGTLVTHATAISAAPATVGAVSTMAATTHTFDVHYYDKSLSC
jgi:hypothetical protein